MMKKLISLLTAAIILTSSLIITSCTEPENENTGNTNDIYLDNLPDGLNFEGKEIVIVYAEGGGYDFTARSISADEESADSVDKKIYERNATVESRLNVKIVGLQAAYTIRDLQASIKSSLAASSGEYDIIAGYQYYDITLAKDGYLINLNDLGKGDYADADYLDLSADYWSTDYINSISYKDNAYWITGDISLRYLGGMYCTFVNSRIYEEKLLSTYGDIYTVAKNGNWTLDTLNEMATVCYEDLGAEGTDESDLLGYAWEPNDPIDGLALSSDIDFSTTYEDGSIRIALKNSKTITFVEKLERLLTSNYSLEVPYQDSANVMQAFANGNVAFTVNKIFQAESYLRDMEDDYYIIPAPKLNSNQANYVTGIHDGCTIFGIPYDAPNVAASAATLEALAAESLRIVTPEYYGSALKYKYTRDDASAEMIDIIRNSADSNFGAAWSISCNDIAQYFRANYKSGNASSQLKKIGDLADSKLQELIAELEELDKLYGAD